LGSVAGPGARELIPWEQVPAWPGHDRAKELAPPCNDFPDIQDPKTPLGP